MDQKKIGRFIAALRKDKNLTQAQLGERVGVTNKTISRWENGNYLPDIAIMPSLCAELGINVNELLSGERLDNTSFRQEADQHLVACLQSEKKLRRTRSWISFLEGGGTGILLSTIQRPESIGKNMTLVIALSMIVVGWLLHSRYEKQLQGQWQPSDE